LFARAIRFTRARRFATPVEPMLSAFLILLIFCSFVFNRMAR
jgi:hypothetical protein